MNFITCNTKYKYIIDVEIDIQKLYIEFDENKYDY